MGILSRFKAALAPIVEDAGYPRISASIASPRSGGSYLDYSRSSGRYYADGAKWANGLSSNGSAPIIDHTTMRANARSASHDSLAARGILQRFAQTVVDRGVRIECAPIASMLGITEEEAEAWATDHETRFDLWARSQTCTVDESLTFYQLQRALVYMRKRDGEYFVRCYYDPRRDLLNPLRLGIIDPNQIQGDALTDSMWARTYGDGIDRDEYGREVAFNVLVQHADGTATREKIPAVSPRTGLPFVLHGFSPEYAGQSRGFSAIGHALQEIENLGDFEAATIKKAINQAAITMYVKPGDDAPALNPLADYASGAVSGYQAAQAPTTATSELAEDPVSYSEMNDVVLRPGSVGVFNLQEGEDLVPFNSTSPSSAFETFYAMVAGNIAASLNMPPELAALRFGQSFSAMRGVLIMYWRTACIERDDEESDLYNHVFRAWLTGEIAAGRSRCPGWSDPRMRAAWCACSWSGPPMPNIDPSKTMNADKGYVELGAQTLDMVARDYNGSSGPANRAKLKRQIGQLTVPPWASRSSSAAPAPSTIEENTESNSEQMQEEQV